MNAPKEQPIDFSSLRRLEPKEGSFEQMLARRALQTGGLDGKTVPFPDTRVHRQVRPYWAGAVAALLVIGVTLGTWLSLQKSPATDKTVLAALSSSATSLGNTLSSPSETGHAALNEAMEWYGELGAGSSTEPLVVADALFESF